MSTNTTKGETLNPPTRNIKLLIAYDGTGYGGWQRQNNAKTIQGEIEQRLVLMTGEPIFLHGAGRTDAGVHAAGMVAHFHCRSRISTNAFLKGLNSLLPPAIRILEANEVDTQFHARFSAKGKTYIYHLYTGEVQLPHQRLYTLHHPPLLTKEAMITSMQMLIGTHDFSSFEASGSRDIHASGGRGAVRTMYQAFFAQSAPHLFYFQFTGDGFLRHMVRNLVGTLLETGMGRRSAVSFAQTLQDRKRSSAGPTAAAHALTLAKVLY